VVEAVLYEGYVLWPYRRSARKNQQRWTFGGVYPPAFVESARSGDACRIQTQCLVVGSAARVDVELRFLQVVERRVALVGADGSLEFVDELHSGSQRVLAWDEAVERRIADVGQFTIESDEAREAVDGGVIVRAWETLNGVLETSLQRIDGNVARVSVTVTNTSGWSGSDRGSAQRHGFMSAHIVLRVCDGAFVCMTDPPSELQAAIAECQNVGVWPVLVGDDRTMLASPIVLEDYPRIAPESRTLMFDSGEIDQLLMLNTLTLTDAEKAEVRATDPRAREILDRAEALSVEDLWRLNGRLLQLDGPPAESVIIDGAEVRAGSTVRLHPRGRADVFDLVLGGQVATVESIEQDFDDRIQLAVTLDADPGRDLGMARLPGHRFFFSPEEVEPIG
jgi:hypothetical protein